MSGSSDNTLSHCVQPGIHVNGGSFVYVANNTLTDCNLTHEEDPNVQSDHAGACISTTTR